MFWLYSCMGGKDKINILLSIKPTFVEKTFDCTKRYEFRRVIFKKPYIKKVIITQERKV